MVRPDMRGACLGVFGLALVAVATGCGPVARPRADGVGVFIAGERSSLIHLRTSDGRTESFEVGGSDGLPVAGDWDGDGRDTVGYFEPGTDSFHLADDFGAGPPQFSRVLVGWNCPPCFPLAGKFGGEGVDGVGLYDPSRGLFLLRERAEPGSPIRTVAYGEAGRALLPFAGDFADCPEAQLGLYDPGTATFRIRACSGRGSEVSFVFGNPGGLPVAGRWGVGSGDGVGVFDPGTGRFLLRIAPRGGPPDLEQPYFRAPARPIAGRWRLESS